MTIKTELEQLLDAADLANNRGSVKEAVRALVKVLRSLLANDTSDIDDDAEVVDADGLTCVPCTPTDENPNGVAEPVILTEPAPVAAAPLIEAETPPEVPPVVETPAVTEETAEVVEEKVAEETTETTEKPAEDAPAEPKAKAKKADKEA